MPRPPSPRSRTRSWRALRSIPGVSGRDSGPHEPARHHPLDSVAPPARRAPGWCRARQLAGMPGFGRCAAGADVASVPPAPRLRPPARRFPGHQTGPPPPSPLNGSSRCRSRSSWSPRRVAVGDRAGANRPRGRLSRSGATRRRRGAPCGRGGREAAHRLAATGQRRDHRQPVHRRLQPGGERGRRADRAQAAVQPAAAHRHAARHAAPGGGAGERRAAAASSRWWRRAPGSWPPSCSSSRSWTTRWATRSRVLRDGRRRARRLPRGHRLHPAAAKRITGPETARNE